MTDKQLLYISKPLANQHLAFADKKRWVDLHNTYGNFYHLSKDGIIEDVPASGWWY